MENHFDTDIAEHYDQPEPTEGEIRELASCVRCLNALAKGGKALEFAIGTGRVALPLLASGIPVSGIELSEAMVKVMRRKAGADQISVTIGDMATTELGEEFDLVFLVYNTIGNLMTQEAQVQAFQNAAAHLKPGGVFVIENYIPPLRRFPIDALGLPFSIGQDHTGIDTIDTVTQRLVSHHYTRTPDGSMRYSATPQRYTWPAEQDLMARLAGLTLKHRWADWDQAPFTEHSTKHISVWANA